MNYGLGLDAGGTYTDAVLVDLVDGSVVEARKAPTTQNRPAIGIEAALTRIEPDLLRRTALVSLATTFATNAIVEDRGGRAGIILIGYHEIPPAIPSDTPVIQVAGGHSVTGEEQAPLALRQLEAELDAFVAGLDAVAVTGYFSVRNPTHEIRVADTLMSRYALPVVRGHRLSLRLDALKRATTAWWNARLIPVISRLIRDVGRNSPGKAGGNVVVRSGGKHPWGAPPGPGERRPDRGYGRNHHRHGGIGGW
jgi:N-methylhydantoinase A/oxoprolinase/acetone carboxylase beta subunit